MNLSFICLMCICGVGAATALSELLATGNMAQDTSDSAVAAPTPLILKESEIIKAQAQNGGDLSIIISVLQITNA